MSVVVGYIPTREGRAALEAGVTEAILRTLNLVVVSSRRDPSAEGESDVEADLAAHLGRLSMAGLTHEVRRPAPVADPAEDLLRIAAEVAASLIVIGLRRRSPVGKLLLGSNAQRILLDAPCPVLAVKAGSGG